MTKLSYKYKIIIVIAGFLVFALGMFMFGYDILNQRNSALADAAIQRQSEYEMLLREQKSFEQGQKDLTLLEQKPYSPDELFSKDTKVVKEIKILEDVAAQNGVSFELSIAGSSKTAPKAPGVISEVLIVPYTATIEGSFEGLMRYLQKAERLPFVTHTKTINISVNENKLRAQLNSEFYIKK